jgi:cyclophilin family peptidyl-prolyl cis-trans isomerase
MVDLRWNRVCSVALGAAIVYGIPTASGLFAQSGMTRRTSDLADDGRPVGTRSGRSDFDLLLDDWNRVDQQLDALSLQVRGAAVNRREEFRQQYVELVREAWEILPQLRKSAIDEYRLHPNQDPDVTLTLVGLLAHEVRNDQAETAVDIAGDLIEHGCEHISLFNLAGRATYCLNDFDNAKRLLQHARERSAIDKQADEYLRELEVARTRWRSELEFRQRDDAASEPLPRVRLRTTQGDVLLELFENDAPQTVGNFVQLVESRFYDGLTFHRVVPNLMAQTGDPTGNGFGGPGYAIYDEVAKQHRNHFRGSLSMAKTKEPNTAGSQFFITFRPVPELDGKHTVFGRVVDGMEVIANLQKREANSQLEPDRILTAEVDYKRPHEYRPNKVR